MLIEISITIRPTTIHAATWSAGAILRSSVCSELEVDELSRFIAHAHHGYRDHRGDQESPDRDRKLPIEAWVRFPELNELNGKQESHTDHCRKSGSPGAEVEIAEI